MNIYRKCTSEPYSFLTIDTTLPADDPLRFRKNLLDSLDGKIKENQAQYNLDKEAAKISALSSGKQQKLQEI